MLAVIRRTIEELGAAPKILREVGTVTYRLTDTLTGLVEHEFSHLFVGISPDELSPDSAEVQKTRFVTPSELEELATQDRETRSTQLE